MVVSKKSKLAEIKALFYGFDNYPQVVKFLSEKHGIKKAFWVGHEAYPDVKISDVVFRADAITILHEIPVDFYRKFFELHFLKIAPQIARLDAYTGSNSRYDVILAIFYRVCRFCYDALIRYKPDIVVASSIPHEVVDSIFQLMCKELGFSFFCLIAFPYYPGKIHIVRDIAEEYGVIDEECVSDGTFDFDRMGMATKKFRGYVKNFHSVRDRYVFAIKNKFFISNVIQEINYRRRMKKNSRRLSEFQGKKFAYCPLHYQPEAATISFGHMSSENQLVLIREVSKLLPKDHVLLVKENPLQNFYYRPKEFFEELNALENVALIEKTEDSRVLANQCTFAVTIAGTIGWEVLKLGKAVICAGYPLYRNLPGVFSMTDGLNIDDVLNFQPDFTRLYSQAGKLYSAAFDGILDPDYCEEEDKKKVGSEENAITLAASIASYLMVK